MALTVTALRARLGPRLGPYVGLADLDDAIGYAMREQGLALADPLVPADSDLAALQAGQLNQMMDVAACRGLETILLNLTDEMLADVGIRGRADDHRPRIERIVATLRDYLRRSYGIGLPVMQVAVVSYNDTEQAQPGRVYY